QYPTQLLHTSTLPPCFHLYSSSFYTLFYICPPFLFFFNDTAPTEIYTLSLHDALPISRPARGRGSRASPSSSGTRPCRGHRGRSDRKSTRLNSSHRTISYAVFCLKKKKKNKYQIIVIYFSYV